ncbi:MAG: M48 family metallopeptidase, partial [Ketobacteraceae bacterium]|nr:M48 family metallopeptidase [Ketobacteraceae bacterium]
GIPSIQTQLNRARHKRVFNWSLLLACVVVIVALPLLLLTRMDWVSDVIAEQVPARWEHNLGETTIAQVKVGRRVVTSDAATRSLKALTEPLFANVESDRYEFEVIITNDPAVNAFALPGGFIVINAGLIQEADNASEVQGVLAHEIAHVTEQHGIRNIINTAGICLLVDALLGDVSGVLAMLANAAPLLINQSYSRKFETEADERGLALLERANIDPVGLVTFFEKMLKREQERMEAIEDEDTRTLVEDAMGFISTHPATEDRIAHISELAQSAAGPFTSYQAEFRQLQQQVNEFMSDQSMSEGSL